MARFSLPSNQRTNPVWAAETLDYKHIMPGGARLNNDPTILAAMLAFRSGVTIPGQSSQVSMRYRIQSGTVVARNIGQSPINVGRTAPGSAPTVSPAVNTQGNPFATPPAQTSILGTTVGQIPAPGSAAAPGTSLPAPAPGGTAYVLPNRDAVVTAAGTTVWTPGAFMPVIPALLPVAAPIFADPLAFELYLVAFEVPDIEINPDIELVRWGTLIYENMLPFVLYPTEFGVLTTANIQMLLQHIRVRYHCTTAQEPYLP
jgi:hypothetical protein